jgi:hypothetical protein
MCNYIFFGSLTQFKSHGLIFFIWRVGTAARQTPFFGAPLLYATNIQQLLCTQKHNLSHSEIFHTIRKLRLYILFLSAVLSYTTKYILL